MARKDAIVTQLRSGVEQLMAMPGISFVRGHGELQADGTVLVNGETLTADNILLATGSQSKLPPIPGIDLPCVMTSTELLSIDHVPSRLCIVGAGVIGLELAGIFAAYGADVTVIEFMKECLPQMDSDIAKRLRKQLEKRGIKFHLGAAVKSLSPVGEGCQVTFEKKDKEETIEAEIVLIATGRAANIEGIGTPETLAALGIQVDRRGIVVNPDTFEAAPNIYAIGDVNGRQMLAHAAESQAHRVINTILGRKDGLRLEVMPAAVFTTPEVACVGPTEDQLQADGRDFIVHKGMFRANGRALCIGETEGLVKLITDADDHLLAAHIMGPHAADLIQEVTTYITLGATLQQLRDTVHIHPTLSEVLIEVN